MSGHMSDVLLRVEKSPDGATIVSYADASMSGLVLEVQNTHRLTVMDERPSGLRVRALEAMGWVLHDTPDPPPIFMRRCDKCGKHWTRPDAEGVMTYAGCLCVGTPSEENVCRMLATVGARLEAYRLAAKEVRKSRDFDVPEIHLRVVTEAALQLDALDLMLLRPRAGDVLQLVGNSDMARESLNALAQKLGASADGVLPPRVVIVLGEVDVHRAPLEELEQIVDAARALRDAHAERRETRVTDVALGFAGGNVVQATSEATPAGAARTTEAEQSFDYTGGAP